MCGMLKFGGGGRMGRGRCFSLPLLRIFLLGLFSGAPAGSDPGPERVPQGASTLAFVFDVTGSMYDDLVQVIEGASKILETSLSRPKRPLHNFALVPFHDPEIGPVTITTDPKKFQNELRELYVQGGGDCPEMSIGAIKIALEISLPGSFIYVFTDARSKDYKLAHEVLQLIQQKQSQVVFVLTGDCDDRSHIGYKVYEEIASTSSGQVFHLDKKQVNEVLKWVEEAVQSSKVHLLSTDHYNPVSNTWQIPFDPSLKEVTVSLSGPAPGIEIRNPQGKLIGSKDGLTELLHIPNSAKVLNLKDPVPGMWSIKTISEGRHSVRITGLSTIDFRGGFSRKHTLDFKMTSSRPVQGIPTFILLNTTGLSRPARADRLELLSITGGVLKTLPIRYFPDRKPYSIWNITEFLPPNEAFFLKVTGYDRNGYLFQRVSSVSFSSIVPDAPKVTMPSQTPGYYLQKGSISCHVDSLIPYTVRFTREGERLGVDQLFKESSNVSLEIPQVSLKDEGYYECIGISSAGTGRARTFLDVSEPPPSVTAPFNVTSSPGSVALLTCVVVSTVRFNLTWQRGSVDIRPDVRTRITTNFSLEIQKVTPDDAGWYGCTASNEGGMSSSRIYLSVQAPPVVSVNPQNQTFSTGEEVWIRCSAKGFPTPTVVWTHNDMFIMGSSRHRMTPDGSLVIRNMVQKDAGAYGCLASNVAGTDTQTALLTYIESPQVTVPQSRMLIGLGQTVIMECKVTGIPQPEVLWYKGDQQVKASVFVSVDPLRGSLSIRQTEDSDAGDYICAAVNLAGTAQGKITLDVGSAPLFIRQPSDAAADIGSNVTLSCHAQGHPEPRIFWRREDNSPLFSRRHGHSTITQKRSGDLLITNLWVEDGTTYVCEAQNQFGKIQAKARVTVTGLVSPVIALSSAEVSVIEEQQVTLPCVLLAGNPLPQRHWLHENTLVTSGPYVSIRRDGSLHIERVSVQDGGEYTCVAENVAGSSNRSTNVHIYVMPTIQHGPQVFSTIEGKPISLPCRAHGVPKPDITWAKRGEPLDMNGGLFSLEDDGSLLIVSPSGQESGEFVCTATNAAGYSSRKVQLTVYVRPRLSGGGIEELLDLSVKLGDDVTLPCEVQSVPPPIVTWAKDKQLISPYSPRHIQLTSGSMKITETRLTDSGMYLCVATNIAGNFSQSVRLSILVPPTILAGPRVMKVQAEHSLDLPCVAQGVPQPSLTWLKDGTSLLLDEARYSVSTDGTLTVQQVALTDEGVYTCVASNIAGQDEASIMLQVQVPPVVEVFEPPFNSPLQERVANQRIAFPCPAKGLPQPVIKWFRNGQELTGNEPGVSILEDGTLLILASVSPLDNGEYTCTAVNDAGSTEKKYQLKVNVPPDVNDGGLPSNVSVVMNQPTNLVCDVTGTPPPVITWYKDGVPVVSSSNVQILQRGKTLRLLKSTTADAGHYSCKAINIAGSTEKGFYLDVLVPPTIIGRGGSRDLSAILNQEISLECKVKGMPFPTIQWYKDRKLVFLGDPNIEVSDRGQVLKIKSARLGDQARYQCSVTNSAGKQTKDFNLSIYVPPTIKGGNVTSEVTALLENSVNLECEARGVPLPAITWYKNGEAILSSRHAQYVDRGQFLKISRVQVSDAGHYTCKVTSVAGTAEKAYELDVYVPPSITGGSDGPMEKKVVVSKSLTLECEAGGHPPPSLTWLKDGSPVKAGENLQVLEQGRKIQILNSLNPLLCNRTNVSAVLYDSSSTSPVSVIDSLTPNELVFIFCVNQSVTLVSCFLLMPPTVDGADESTDATVIINNLLELECHATGTPPPTITWLKDGKPVRQGEGVRITANGRRLVISRAQVSDTALFQCVATNEAGDQERDFKVTVHVPPSIRSTGPSERSVIQHNPISLQCVASGVPAPSITWLKDGRPPPFHRDAFAITWFKDGRPLTSAAGVSVLNRGQVLEIDQAQVSDAGLYKCVAISIAGKAELTHSLQVYVPPSISSKGGMVTVVVNDPVRLECEASGLPVPSLTWLKEGSPVSSSTNGIQVLAGGRVLSFSSAQVSDTGHYTCVAVNAGGEQQKEYDLHVYVPPNIMGDEVNSTVLIGQSVELLCQSDAVPPPTLTWRKDGRSLYRKPGMTLSEDGSVLKIANAQLQDTGRYTCEATNVAGKTEKNYNLNVLVRPSITTSASGEVTVVRGGDVTLQCVAEGVPRPAVTWLKDGRPLVAGAGAQVLSEGRLLQIKDAQVAYTGRYTCIAVNVAGQTDSKYDVMVHVPASISGQTLVPENVSVVVRNPVALTCEASGIPLPVITWLKDGRTVSTSGSVRIISGGRSLRLMHTAVDDAGRYTCIVSNAAGEDRKNFDLDVLVPPSILNQGGLQDVRVKEGQNVTLTCEATGNPVPEISWLKDGQAVVQNARLQVMSHGRFLHISEAQVVDTGRYSCLASNSAGDRSTHFNLNVLVSPTIAGSGPEGSSEEVTVTLNSPTSLVCEAQSYPPAIINWLKDGMPFESSRNVRVLPGGRTLQILNAQEEDAGRYTCVATNEAGETLKNYEVKVYIPPVISKDGIGEGFAPREIKIKVNNTLTLECEAQAIPTPSLQWYKDGQILKAEGRITITTSGRIVQIKQAQVSDTGRYTCVATNIAGEDEKDFDVNIQVPPSFRGNGGSGSGPGPGGDTKDVILNNPLSLYCETNAVPPPTLTWYKDGRPIASNDRVLILPGGRVLQVPRALAEDSGRYTCVAVNEAGEDSIQYDVRVLLPPSIRGADRDVPDEAVVLVNKTTLLECHADGSPSPKISWFKDSLPLHVDRTHTLLSNGRTLQILNAQVTDTGRYKCVAENVAGSAEKYFNLNVHVPPTILGVNMENATVVVNNFISLSCEATGLPPPTLSWLKDRRPVRANTNALIMPGGRTLQILKAKLSDGGKYSCVAINPAGEAQKLIYLTVFVPPSIRDGGGDSPVVVSVRVRNSVTLECQSNAVPTPTITWYKNGRLITETANLRILADGQMLKLKGAEVSDTGQYVCKATNVAGQVDKNFHLNIYVPPSIDGPAEEHVVETISNPVTFSCDATGIPPPSLTWIKNGRVIENSESLEMHILSGGSKLQIARSQLSDSGTYICLASNIEGKARKSYHLTIHVPPSIVGSDLPGEVSVLLNDSIQLVCQAEGTPPPTIQWLKDGQALSKTGLKNIRISPDGSILTITAAHTADGGKYTCLATNKAGEEDKVFNINVYVPPEIQGNGDVAEELTAVQDSSLNIECVASGSPPPQLNWLKNGLPLPVSAHTRLLSAGQLLRITRVQVSDEGTYTCVASNRAGVDNRHYSLQVYVPPSLDGAGSTDDVTLVRGSMVALVCISDGTPTPVVSWLKEGSALPVEPHTVLLNHNSTLQISHVQIRNTGHYTCLARNQAGEAQRHFNLKILDPPRINGSGFHLEVSVVVNHVLELVCEAEGIPAPTLTWVKDGRPLPQTHNLRFLRGGEVLRISSAQVEDTGRYTCLATSPAGDDDKEFLVRVHVPPNIAGESGVQDVSVLQNRQVTLECKSDAVPPPTLSWLKDGAPLKASPRVRVLSSGRYLQINNAELGDAGRYTCMASNIAGETRRHFNLSVNVVPTIQEGPQAVSVHINQPVVLECIVSGIPAPQVTWRKHGAILAGNSPRYAFSPDGSLHIHSAQVTDTGRYLCMATNQAGTQRRRVDLQVYVPPSISEGPTNVTVIVNIQTTLSCEASGIPKPTVTWTKDTRPLNTDQNQNMYRLLSSGSLVVIAPTVEDTALYECVVSNEAGQDSKVIHFTVHVPPSIADEATELVVNRLSQVVIGCSASGVPQPVLHWTKDGLRLAEKGEGYRTLPSGPLEITAAELSHAGRYTCFAKNAAGSAHRYVHVIVQEPPVIQTHPSTLDVILNSHITLPCRAVGSPRPTITWQKEGINIFTSGGDLTVLPSGGLQISRAKAEDAGTYMCVAQNPAGTALGKTKLRVQVPPVIVLSTKSYSVAVDGAVTLQCQAEGYPTPSVSWHKDGQPLAESVRQRVLSSGSLHIAFTQPGDTGKYTCTAANAAGSSSIDMSLTILIPPSVHGGEPELWVAENTQALLSCVVEGVPQPSLSWEKEGVPLTDTVGEYTILPTGELIIDKAQPEDAGSYTCVATNSVGQDSQTITLSIHTHPAFTELLGDVSLNKGDRLLLTCGAIGIPPPKITWAFNNNIVPAYYDHVNGHSELVIEHVSKDDAGTYSCVAENRVGSIKSLGFVYVKEPPIIDGDVHSNHIEPLGGNAILNCEVRGDPLPTIQWSKKGIIVQISNRIRQLDNGSLAIYGTVSEDAGNYVCVATNDAGVVERTVTLTIQSSPVFTVEPVDTVVDSGSTVVLNCQAQGEPTPVIEWASQGRPLLTNERITTLTNGSLRLSSAQKEDTAEYECVARNLMGSALVRMTLTVRVHGGYSEWMKWGACSVSCGTGVQKRLRQCNNPRPANGGRHCTGSDSETRSCQGKPCPVDGQWSEWSSWEECSRTCGQGNRTRIRTCSKPPAQHGGRACEGRAVEVIMCSIRPCPVAGNWGSWLPWSPCSETCGKGMQMRIRLCNSPPPSFDGPPCQGADTQTQVCTERSCPVDGKWSSWVSWGACSVSCGGGTRQRTRLCASPAPQHGGRQCEGNDVHIDFCNSEPCPVNGNWGPWNSWGSCSRTCNGGQMRRYRTCDNPRPANGGRACAGTDTEIQKCSTASCPVDGNWGPWQPWGQCSASCGVGERTRMRLCNSPSPSNKGRPCPGDYTQVSKCNAQPCPGGPQKARGSVIGNINDVEFGIAILNATISSSPSGGRVVHATITNIPRSLGPAMRKLISLLNPIYWTTAQELGEAVNGYTLTDGIFRRETQVEFATGEILRMTHISRGVDTDGALLLDIVVNGHILQLPSNVDITLKDYTEDYIQTGPGQLYALSTRMFSVDRVSVPYSWNHTVSYDPSRGKMPYLVQTLHASAVSAHYRPLEEILEFTIHTTIAKGERSNQCPSGFLLDPAGPYCADENECVEGNPCSHACHNSIGTYYCSCPVGLTISADGRTCQDIDECSLSGHICHDGQDCENTIGSYRCVMRCGRGFRRTADGLSCSDINECQESKPCHQHCLNTIGSFRCACEPGYQLRNRRCIDINECRQRVCRSDQQCKNTRGGYTCIDLCPTGMTKGVNGSCVDIDECRDGTHLCRYNQICENTRGSYHCTCPRGYRSQGVGQPCLDINECEQRDMCQHECMNTPGSHKCLCPSGYRLMTNGKACQDIDECLEQHIQCGVNRMCFNMRGSYQCIDTPCPPNYQRDPNTGFCLKNCPPNDLECALSPYALEYKLLSLPFGIAANQDLIRLVAYTQDGVMHPRTTFLVVDEDTTLPFALRDENLKGVLFTTRPLREPHTYRMKVKALSYSTNGGIEYQTTFIVYIAVSAYPY
ncbi:hemicentin-1 [Hoplias malabaricus]|uniref:hemicentin-1 n=1 Tax=Hoplias malabaricus TaxID=27720 RepID=UPI0034623D21